jgi:hypothetical protein
MKTYSIKTTNVREKIDNTYISNKYSLKFEFNTDISFLANPSSGEYETITAGMTLNNLTAPIIYIR